MRFSLILFLIFTSACGWVAAQEGGLRYTVQVRKFENKANWAGQWDLGDAWGAVLTDKLQNSGKFIVVAEQDMRNEAMDEQDFSASGRTAGGNKDAQTGQMTPAQILIKGVITQFDDGTSGGDGGLRYKGVGIRLKSKKALIQGTVYLVDSTTGAVVESYPFEETMKVKGGAVSVYRHGVGGDLGGFTKTPAGQLMAQACDKIVDQLQTGTSSISWSGTVIRGGDKDIIINRGTREGVSEGMVFRIGQAEEIRDPDTGELLATDFKQKGLLKVTRVLEKICYAEKIDGEAPKKGQTVFQ